MTRRISNIVVSVPALDADGIHASSASTGTIALDGALVSGGVVTFDPPQHISIANDNATDLSALTFTITGTDRQGNAISEAITGPGSGATVVSTVNFKTVTSASVSSTTGAGTFVIGSHNSMETGWIPLSHYGNEFNVGLGVDDISGTNMAATVQFTMDDVFADDFDEVAANATALEGTTYTQADLGAVTAAAYASITMPVTAVRLKLASWTTAGTCTLFIVPSG